jgi:hypothetical protein
VVNRILAADPNANINYTFGYIPGWANGNAGVAAPPSDLGVNGSAYFNNFVSCIVARYAGKIKFWEMWNEPSIAGTWSGTTQQMVYMAKGAYAAAKAANPSAVVLTPSSISGWWTDATGAYQSWMAEYLADGGGPYADSVALHTYPADTPPQPPEYLANIVAYAKYAMAANGIGGDQIFSTEWNCAASGNCAGGAITDPVYLAVYYILGWPLGLVEQGHYEYDSSSAEFSLTGNNQGLNLAGAAYRVVENWLLGSTWTSAPARQAGANGIRNPSMSGAVAGSGSTCATMTNGTPPTNMSVFGDTTYGVNWQIVAAGAGYIDFRVCGTETAGGSGQTQLLLDSTPSVVQNQWETLSINLALVAGSFANNTPAFYWNEATSGGGYLTTDAWRAAYPQSESSLDVAQQAYWTYTTKITNASAAHAQAIFSIGYSVGQAFDVTLRITSPSIDTGTVWQGDLTQANGTNHRIVWDVSGGPTAYSTSYGYWRGVDSSRGAAVAGNVTITNSPIILDVAIQGVRF